MKTPITYRETPAGFDLVDADGALVASVPAGIAAAMTCERIMQAVNFSAHCACGPAVRDCIAPYCARYVAGATTGSRAAVGT